MFSDLLEPDYGKDMSPKDDTRITQIILYFDEPDAKELKAMAKEVMKRFWPEDYTEKGNLSDLYLKLLKEKYDTIGKQSQREEVSGAEAFI